MRSSVTKGDDLERKVYDYLRQEIENNRFVFRGECCRVYRKKGYYSKDRGSDIVFDVSIEVFLPGHLRYSAVFLVECKNYGRAVRVDDLEEFYAKVQQVASSNSKAVLVSTNSFQRGARNFAKSKGIGLARFTDPLELKWELERSPSANARSVSHATAPEIEAALAQEDNNEKIFDFVFESGSRVTSSLWGFFGDLLQDMELDERVVLEVANDVTKLKGRVPYITVEEIEDLSARAVAGIEYVAGAVDLNRIAASIPRLRVVRKSAKHEARLGVASFGSREIVLYADNDEGRKRFTFAHELSHFLLDHGRFMSRDTCDESDLVALKPRRILPGEVRRMEYQANLLASSLLMPRQGSIRAFLKIAAQLDLHDRGFGYLYYDNQVCNMRDFMGATSALMNIYGVSRVAARIRLEALGFLKIAPVGLRKF